MLKSPEAGTFRGCPLKDTLALSEFVQTGILRFKVNSFPIPCKKIRSIRISIYIKQVASGFQKLTPLEEEKENVTRIYGSQDTTGLTF